MTTSKSGHTLDISRRRLLRGAAIVAGGGALVAAGVAASAASAQPAKVAKNLVSYQDSPKGDARCDNCTQWEPPSSCKVVEGEISPSGWCSLYAAKS